jgi:putative transposase
MVTELQAQHQLARATACRYLGVHRALVRYRPRRPSPGALVAALLVWAERKPRWGGPRLTWRLCREGWVVNHKCIERLLRTEHLLVGQRSPPKRAAVARVPAPTPTRPDERWSIDFVRNTTAEGRPFRVWTLVDDYTHESPLLVVDRSLPARRVVEALDALLLVRGASTTIVCDNGPEFVSLALDQWASGRGIRLAFIRPGRPVENCFIESFNGKLRDECLNTHHFATLAEARQVIEQWRVEYNAERPHRGLGQQTPMEYAAGWTSEARPASPTSSDYVLA